MDAAGLAARWEALGERRSLLGHPIFVVDVAAGNDAGKPPLLVLHGFPTSSIDFATTLPALHAERRVVLLDFLGFGLSGKPDQRYSLFDQADLVEAVAASCALDRVDLLTHDMGDSVGGELLARSLDGILGFEVARRVITNGSIYIDMAVFTDGQKLLLSLPDERADLALGREELVAGLRATLAPDLPVDEAHLLATAESVCRGDGVALLPRLIRYIEERREHEGRWTGAIETHPAPASIVWADLDPVAVYAMAERLRSRRPDAGFTRLEGVGHYPMIEAPKRFTAAVSAGLS